MRLFKHSAFIDNFKCNISENLLKLSISQKYTVELDALNLIASTDASEICRCSYHSDGLNHIFDYNISGLSSLKAKKISDCEYVCLLKSLLSLFLYCEDNALNPFNIVNSQDCIYFNRTSFSFIYIPVKINKKKKDYYHLILNILRDLKNESPVIAKFIKSIKKLNDDSVIEQLKKYVQVNYEKPGFCNDVVISDYHTISNYPDTEGETTVLNSYTQSDYPDTEGETTVLNSYTQSDYPDTEGETTVLNSYTQSDYPDTEGETTVLNSYTQSDYPDTEGETTVLNSYIQSDYPDCCEETTILSSNTQDDYSAFDDKPTSSDSNSTYGKKIEIFLIRNCTGEMFEIPLSGISIGSKESVNNIVIPNPSISRVHASISYDGDEVFIIDNNSTNGTTVEGTAVPSGVKVTLYNGSLITLGNESFQITINKTL